MFKNIISRKLMLAAFTIISIVSFFVLAAYAGGPEPLPDGIEVKKGKIKGVLTIEFTLTDEPRGTGIVDISLVGRCQKKDSVDDKYIGPTYLCEDCFNPQKIGEAAFLATTENDLLTWFLPNIAAVSGCFRPDLVPMQNEDIFISAVRDFSMDIETDTITAIVTLRAIGIAD